MHEIGINLKFSTVIQVAKIISGENIFDRIKNRRYYFSALIYLIKTENLLHPRDGQIEAKDYRIDGEGFSEKLLLLIWKKYWEEEIRLSPEIRLRTLTASELDIYFSQSVFYLVLRYFVKSVISFESNPSKIEANLDLIFQLNVAYTCIANAYSEVGFYETAKKLYLKSSVLRKKNPFSHGYTGSPGLDQRLLGDTFFKQGLYEESIEAYQNAVELDSRYSICWNRLGKVYTIKQELNNALAAYQKALELFPERPYYHASLAGIFRKLGKVIEAEEHEKEARLFIHLENEYYRACYESICGNKEEALHLLKIALKKKQYDREWLNKEPDFDFIREDQRFKEFIRLE